MSKISPSRPNYIYAILSVTLVLFLLGFFGILILHGQELLNSLKERINFIVELEDDITPGQLDSVEITLKSHPYIIPSSVTYISKDDAFRMLKEDFGDEIGNLDLPNPLYDIYTFNVRSLYLEPVAVGEIKSLINIQKGVSGVYYQEGLIEKMAQNLNKLGLIILLISLILVIVAISLIHNTIKLSLYANRLQVKHMELVGATWSFISKPYLTRSIWHGFLAATIAIILLTLLLLMARRQYIELQQIEDYKHLIYLFAGLIITGIAISFLSTFYIVNKYLKMKIDDLY